MVEAQLLPEPGTKLEKLLLNIDLATTVLFTVELLINIFAHSENRGHEFVTHATNWFDVIIVAVSLFNSISLATGSTIPGAKVIRLLRLGRVLRLFAAFKDLQKLMAAISAALVPVCNAFLMLLIIVSVYAVLGTNFFRKRSPEYFGQFSVSLYTMFQILAEGIAISREIFQEGKTESDVAFYFVSYILIVAIGLLNVVVAVLLDAFQNHVRRMHEKMEEARLLEEEKRKVHGCLDPLTKGLCTFEDEADLTSRIDEIYSKLDEDESGGLAFEEFREGVKWLSKNIHLTRDDFDVVTENGKHLGPTAEFNRENFQKMMKGELWRYSRRELANVQSVSGDEKFNSTILMLKIMESSTDRALAEVLRLLRSISDPQHKAAGSASPGTGGGGERKGVGEKEGEGLQGLGEVLHKLSSNMEQTSAKIYRQSNDMEHMPSKMGRRFDVLEDQMAAINRLQATEASSSAQSSAPPLPNTGTGGGGERTGVGEKEGEGLQGLGKVLHKLSSNIEHMLAKIDRQSNNMEQMSSKVGRRFDVLEDQMAAIKRLQATEASSSAQSSAPPLPRKFEHKAGVAWVGNNETDHAIGQQTHSFLAAPSTSLEQISNRVTPSQNRKQNLNDLVVLQSYYTSAGALQGREGRNEGRKEAVFLSTTLPRYMEHVQTDAEVDGSSSNEYKTEKAEDMMNDKNVEQKLTGLKSSLHFHHQNVQVRR
jgi:voltage-gated sodium channel